MTIRKPVIGEMTMCPCCKKDHLKIVRVVEDIFFMEDRTHGKIDRCYDKKLDRFLTYDWCED